MSLKGLRVTIVEAGSFLDKGRNEASTVLDGVGEVE
jgi:hypothetical protein